ncbi:MAG: hypothetical protein AAB697_00255 [Patescibacteria group bacterium]
MSTFGTIENPFKQLSPGTPLATSVGGSGLIVLISSLYKMAILFAGVYTLWGFIAGGYIFITASGDTKDVHRAWDKIWQSMIGLIIVASALVLGAIISFVVFGDATVLISPKVYTPN